MKEVFIEFPKEGQNITEENYETLEPIYFKITRIFGLRNFTTISEVECNFTTPAGNENFITLLFQNLQILLSLQSNR